MGGRIHSFFDEAVDERGWSSPSYQFFPTTNCWTTVLRFSIMTWSPSLRLPGSNCLGKQPFPSLDDFCAPSKTPPSTAHYSSLGGAAPHGLPERSVGPTLLSGSPWGVGSSIESPNKIKSHTQERTVSGHQDERQGEKDATTSAVESVVRVPSTTARADDGAPGHFTAFRRTLAALLAGRADGSPPSSPRAGSSSSPRQQGRKTPKLVSPQSKQRPKHKTVVVLSPRNCLSLSSLHHSEGIKFRGAAKRHDRRCWYVSGLWGGENSSVLVCLGSVGSLCGIVGDHG